MFETDPKVIAEQLRILLDDAQSESESEERVASLLSYASDIVEGAAFELARMDVPRNVTELILIAGRLDRMATGLRDSEAPEN